MKSLFDFMCFTPRLHVGKRYCDNMIVSRSGCRMSNPKYVFQLCVKSPLQGTHHDLYPTH